MRILHVISQAPDFTGSGKYLQAILSCAKERGHTNFLVAGIQGDFQLDSKLIRENHVRYIRFGTGMLDYPLPGMSDVMPYQSTRFLELSQSQIHEYETAFGTVVRDAIDQFEPDMIHVHHLWLVACVVRRIALDIPMVATCHGTCLRQMVLCPHIADKVSCDIRKIDTIMALSHDQKAMISSIHGVLPERIRVVGGGFSDKLFYCSEKSSQGSVEIVYAGKLSEAKGVPWLLRSMEKTKFQNWKLHLAGGGAGREYEHCLELASKIGGRVIIHGTLSHTNLAELMRQCHLFVLPSFYEGLPLVLMEALASGCRIITTALPGMLEVLGSESSPLVKLIHLPDLETIDRPFKSDYPALEQALASALDTALEQAFECPEPNYREAALVSGKYTWPQIFLRMEEAYQQALNCHRK